MLRTWSSRTSWYQRVDWTVIVVWASLVMAGLLAIYSSTHGRAADFLHPQVHQNFFRQVVWIGVCVAGIVVASLLPVRFYQRMAYPVYGLTVLLVVVALFWGQEINNTRSWLSLGPVGFQTSELAKVGAVLAAAQLLSQRSRGTPSLTRILSAVGLIVLPGLLVILQNDAGTALVFFALIPIVLFWGGLPVSVVLLIITPGVAGYLALISIRAGLVFSAIASIGLWVYSREWRFGLVGAAASTGPVLLVYTALTEILQPYQVARVASFVNPEAYQYTSGFHIIQAKAAVGSGGLWGKGFMQGTQTQLAFVPEQTTDFILCVIGEEFGFVGITVLLGLFAILLIRLAVLGSQAKHPFVQLVAAGAVGVYFIHIVINVGMNLGVMPVVGIPLPFVSYGGSAMLANTSLMAITLACTMHRDDLPIYGY